MSLTLVENTLFAAVLGSLYAAFEPQHLCQQQMPNNKGCGANPQHITPLYVAVLGELQHIAPFLLKKKRNYMLRLPQNRNIQWIFLVFFVLFIFPCIIIITIYIQLKSPYNHHIHQSSSIITNHQSKKNFNKYIYNIYHK